MTSTGSIIQPKGRQSRSFQVKPLAYLRISLLSTPKRLLINGEARPLGVPTICPCPSLWFFDNFSPTKDPWDPFPRYRQHNQFHISRTNAMVFPQPGKDLCSSSRHFISHRVWQHIIPPWIEWAVVISQSLKRFKKMPSHHLVGMS